MKARHKATGLEIELRKPLCNIEYYSTPGGSMIHVGDPAFEVVPEEEWEDVTHEYTTNGLVIGLTSEPLHAAMGKKDRIRKIDGLHHGPAFIVERRKEK